MNYLICGMIIILLVGAFLLMVLYAGTKPAYKVSSSFEDDDFEPLSSVPSGLSEEEERHARNYIYAVSSLQLDIRNRKVQAILKRGLKNLGYSKETQKKVFAYIKENLL